MQEKNTYERLEIETIYFETKDVIVTSGDGVPIDFGIEEN